MRRRLMIIGGIVLVALALTGGAIAVDSQVNDEASATGPEAERAAAAAVEIAGGGRAVEVERDPEGTRVWKVEVAKEGGALVDVELDANYQAVAPDADDVNDANEPDDVNEAPDTETVEQDAAEDAGEVNEPNDDVGDTNQPDNDADDTNDGDND